MRRADIRLKRRRLHSAIPNSAESWATQIASPIVTAIDDGTMENEWGSTNIDDEGTPTTRLTLIENGILKNYMIDRLNAPPYEYARNRQRSSSGLHLRADLPNAQHVHRTRHG